VEKEVQSVMCAQLFFRTKSERHAESFPPFSASGPGISPKRRGGWLAVSVVSAKLSLAALTAARRVRVCKQKLDINCRAHIRTAHKARALVSLQPGDKVS
jgi:hypothetical protein